MDDYRSLKQWLEETADVPLEAMDAFFHKRLDDYEAHMAIWSVHYEWMAAILPETTRTLLDIGCGTGLELDCIYRRFPDLAVTGIDLAADMLAVLQKKHGDKQPTLRCEDYFAAELGEWLYDAVVSFETLHHFPAEQKWGLFQKICRSLKPGGVYLECDYIATSQAIEDLTFAECARRRTRDKIPPEQFVHFDTPLTLAHEVEALEGAGFARVEVVGFLPGDDHTVMLRAIR